MPSINCYHHHQLKRHEGQTALTRHTACLRCTNRRLAASGDSPGTLLYRAGPRQIISFSIYLLQIRYNPCALCIHGTEKRMFWLTCGHYSGHRDSVPEQRWETLYGKLIPSKSPELRSGNISVYRCISRSHQHEFTIIWGKNITIPCISFHWSVLLLFVHKSPFSSSSTYHVSIHRWRLQEDRCIICKDEISEPKETLTLKQFFEAGIYKSTKWSTMPACPSLMCFFVLTGAIPKGLVLRKVCVWCLCKFCFM